MTNLYWIELICGYLVFCYGIWRIGEEMVINASQKRFDEEGLDIKASLPALTFREGAPLILRPWKTIRVFRNTFRFIETSSAEELAAMYDRIWAA